MEDILNPAETVFNNEMQNVEKRALINESGWLAPVSEQRRITGNWWRCNFPDRNHALTFGPRTETMRLLSWACVLTQ